MHATVDHMIALAKTEVMFIDTRLKKTALLVLALFVSHVSGTSQKGNKPKPNFVILFADDLGYGDLGAYGHPTSLTPNLDQLASEGVVFTQFYTASSVCSPSRAALLTGRYQTRSGIYPGVFFPDSIGGLPLKETTIAKTLKSVGYSTAIVGKWHLGTRQYLPLNHGFDYYMGIPYSHNECPCTVCFYPSGTCIPPNSEMKCGSRFVSCPLYEDNKILFQPVDLLTLTTTYTNAANSFIKTKTASGTPFFLYYAFQHTHQPQFAGQNFTNSTIRGPFGDALSELDWAVGQVMQTLKDAGVDDNTFVFFTADNGPSLIREIRGGNAGPLRCGKGTTWEGGQRVPGIARWPGKITPGRTHELAATLDLFPTMAALAGVSLPNVTLDGVDMAPILFENDMSNRKYYIYYPSDVTEDLGIAAVRLNQYKAHFHSQGRLCSNLYPDPVCRDNYTLHHYNPPLLYNLHTDPGEIYNLDITNYKEVMEQVNKLKSDFEAKMVWGESQMDRGVTSKAEPCAQPGCSPFPDCCKTDNRKKPVVV